MKFKSTTTDGRLDDILNTLNHIPSKHFSCMAISTEISPNDIGQIQRNLDEVRIMVDHLIKEGYVQENSMGYSINFAGKIFIEKGGHKESTETKAILYRNKKIQNIVLTVGSALAALGALGLLFFEIIKYCYSCHCK